MKRDIGASAPSISIPLEIIEQRIYLIRGQKVMIDSDLARLYGVEVKRLNQQVSRNLDRFPLDFMFRLTNEEEVILKSQNVTSSGGHGGRRRSRPRAFTEQGVAMLSSVLKTKRAIQVNLAIIRTFVRLRRILASHAGLAKKLEQLEKQYDAQFKVVFNAIRELMSEDPVPPQRQIGFHTDQHKKPLGQ